MANRARAGRYAPVGYQQITDVSAAVGVTVPAAAHLRANAALVTAETKAIRWRDDGTDPTSTVGSPVAAGSDFWYEGDLNALKLIEQSASAKVNVTFYDTTVAG